MYANPIASCLLQLEWIYIESYSYSTSTPKAERVWVLWFLFMLALTSLINIQACGGTAEATTSIWLKVLRVSGPTPGYILKGMYQCYPPLFYEITYGR